MTTVKVVATIYLMKRYMSNINLTEQEILFLDDWLKQELETQNLSATSQTIINNILKKLENYERNN